MQRLLAPGDEPCQVHQGSAAAWPSLQRFPAATEQVKAYCERQFSKILSGRVSVADFVFAKEVCSPGGWAGVLTSFAHRYACRHGRCGRLYVWQTLAYK